MNSVLKYVFDSKVGKVKVVNGKEYKNIIIDDKAYSYNKDKPLSNTLKKKLDKVATTNEYLKHKILLKGVQTYRLNKALRSYAMKNKAITVDEVSAFKNYANSYSITNINLKGLKGLSYLKYQNRLRRYLQDGAHPGMKITIVVYVKTDEGEIPFKSRRYEVLNVDDLDKALINMAEDIELQIENNQVKNYNLIVDKIDKITIHYDRYNPTRGGSYIALPDWVSAKKACINIKNEDNKCFKFAVQCAVFKLYDEEHPERMVHYNRLKDNIINWNHMMYGVGNSDITRFDELNQGLISINVFKIYNETIIADRITKVRNAKYHINILKLVNDTMSHYVLIKDLNKLMSSQYNKSHDEKTYV